MSLYDMYKTDPSLEKDGIWLDYGESKILIARAGGANSAYSKMLEREMRPYRKILEHSLMKDETANRILQKVYAVTVVKGWENVPSAEDPWEFTPEKCVQLFTDLPDLWRDVREMAGEIAAFRVQILEDEAKN